MSRKKISELPSIFTAFGVSPISKGRTKLAWSFAKAKELARDNDFLQMMPKQSTGPTKGLRLVPRVRSLPQKTTTIVEEGKPTARTKKAGIEPRRRLVYLSYVPVQFFQDTLDELNENNAVNRRFSDVDNFVDLLIERSGAIQLEEDGPYHVPIRISGPAENVQETLKETGLDFGFVMERIGEKTPAGYNKYNVAMVRDFAYHGDVTLFDAKENMMPIEANVTLDNTWFSEHPYGELYRAETTQRQAKARTHLLFDDMGTSFTLTDYEAAARIINSAKEEDREKLKYLITTDRDGSKKAIRLGAKITVSDFIDTLEEKLKEIRKTTTDTKEGPMHPKSLSIVFKKGKLAIGTIGRASLMEPGQSKYVVVDSFSFRNVNNIVEVEDYDIAIKVSATKRVQEEKDGELKFFNKPDEDYKPGAVIKEFVNALKGAVSESEQEELREQLTRDLAAQLKAKKPTSDAKETSAKTTDLTYEEIMERSRRHGQGDIDRASTEGDVVPEPIEGEEEEEGKGKEKETRSLRRRGSQASR